MLTTEQYNKIMKQKAMPIINACITTTANPNAATYYGQTNSTKNSLFSFDKTLVEQYKEKIIDIYKDLPRKQGGSIHGYVAFTDFFTDTSDPKRKAWELRLANAFLNLSECADIIYLSHVKNHDNVLSGANAILNMYIPTREEEEKRKNGTNREPGNE